MGESGNDRLDLQLGNVPLGPLRKGWSQAARRSCDLSRPFGEDQVWKVLQRKVERAALKEVFMGQKV